jgi:surface protein
MPQTTSASYNLGNSRQSSRSNSFNRRNSVEFANQQNIIAERLRLVNEAKLLKQKQLSNRPKLAILFNPTTYPPDALKLMEYIKDDTSASRFSIINYTNLSNTLEEQYNLGFRFFASPTIGSFELYTYCIPFCNKYPDALLFTTYSTQYFQDRVLPFNIIRSSVNDKDMAHYIVNEILYKVNTLTKESAPVYYKNISNNEADNTLPIFEKIVYIYTEKDANGNLDTYSEEYGNQLLNAVNLTNGDIEIEFFKISDDNFILPQEVKTLLAENPVSGVNFSCSNKTMFILNSYSPEKILQLFDEEYMYDNYFIFGDVFNSLHYTSKYKFNYAISPVGNYSFEGYKTAGFLPGGRDLSPFLYSICDVILKLLPYYTQIYYKYPNFSSTKFNEYFINRMKYINLFVDGNYWYERKIFTYYIDTNSNDLTNAQYNHHIFFQMKFNPTIAGSVSARKMFIYTINRLPSFNIRDDIPIINHDNVFNIYDVSYHQTTQVGLYRITITFDYLITNSEMAGLSFEPFSGIKYDDVEVNIIQFDGIPLYPFGAQFSGLKKLIISATDTPTILQNTSLESAFEGCINFNSNISRWDVTKAINMKNMFYNCTNFNQNLSNWNVSNVTNMDSMFELATNFNNNFFQLKWDCRNLTSAVNFGLNSSLYGKGSNYNINPGNGIRNNELTSIETPIKNLTQTNKSLPLKIGTFIFSISNSETINYLNIPIINSISFQIFFTQVYDNLNNILTVTVQYSYNIILGNDGLSFKDVISYYGNKTVTISQFGGIPLSNAGKQFENLPNLVISATDTPTILSNTSLNKSFYNCTNFNANISSWNVSNVINMENMFYSCSQFNQNLSNWNVSNVTNMNSMFFNASAFNNNNTPMYWNCNTNLIANNFGDNSDLYINNENYTKNFGNAIRSDNASSIQTPIYKNAGTFIYKFINTLTSSFDISKIPIINDNNSFYILDVVTNISGNITTVSVSYKFYSEPSGNDGFSFKNVANYYINSNVYILQFGDIPLSKKGEQFANVRNLQITATDSPFIFSNTSLFRAFNSCINFNSNISAWNVLYVTNMDSMFYNCSIFNQNISSWDVSNVTNMDSMFYNCSIFNQNINSWDVSNVTNMGSMFYGCSQFNQNINGWNVSNVTNMISMFENASLFNNNNIQMNWDCNTSLVANNFGNNSALYTNSVGDYTKNGGKANRKTVKGYKSIQTPVYNYGTFIYHVYLSSKFNLNLLQNYLPIIQTNNTLKTYSITTNDTSIKIGTTTIIIRTISIPFYYNSIEGDDGLSFKNCSNLYGTNNVNILQFDGIPLSNSGCQFWKLANLVIKANEVPTILPNTSLSQSFYQCTNFNEDLSKWDVSNVTNMDSMFENATKFNNKGIPMFWNFNSLTSALNFGLNSNLYEEGGNFNTNPGNAVRFSNNNVDYYSIETSFVSIENFFVNRTTIYKYKLTSAQVTDITTLKTGTFVYSFINKKLDNFNETEHLPIINNKSSLILLKVNSYNDITKNKTTVKIDFSYRFVFNNDGLSFMNLDNYYKNNLIIIENFDGIPVSNNDEYRLFNNPNLKIACTSLTCPVIKNPLNSGMSIYFTEYLDSAQVNIPNFCKKIRVYLIGGGGSGGQGGGDGNFINHYDPFDTKHSLEGTDGSGGGGGEFVYSEFIISQIMVPDKFLAIGMSPKALGVVTPKTFYDGSDGNTGSGVALVYTSSTGNTLENILTAQGGGGGGGGHRNDPASPGIGGVTKDGLYTILPGYNSKNKEGGASGYAVFIDNNNNKNRPEYFISNLGIDYGRGGRGSEGKKNPNPRQTASIKNCYARIEFIS